MDGTKMMTAEEFFGIKKTEPRTTECGAGTEGGGQDFLVQKGLECLRNFTRNYEGEIDSSTFKLLNRLVSPETLARELARALKRTARKGGAVPPGRVKDMIARMGTSDDAGEVVAVVWNKSGKQSRKTVRTSLVKFIAGLEKSLPEKRDMDIVERKLREIREALRLTDLETRVLLVSYLYATDILDAPTSHGPEELYYAQLFAANLDVRASQVMTILAADSPLRRYACVDHLLSFNTGRLGEFMIGLDKEPFVSDYFTRVTDEALPLAFFGEELARHAANIKTLIDARRDAKPGEAVNVLLYGVPGSGKTSFARTLAQELGRTLYQIPQIGRNRGEQNSVQFRFGAMSVCEAQVMTDTSVILVDEADRMLGGGDKGLLNASMDRLATPVIWVSNNASSDLDESSRRRFDYSIRFEPLNARQRECVWNNRIGKWQVGDLFPKDAVRRYAETYPVNAGVVSLVVDNIARIHPSAEKVEGWVETLMKQHCELLGVQETSKDVMAPAQDYSLDGLNVKGDIALPQIVAAVRNFKTEDAGSPDRPRMNLLLSGAPGTGKTEFVKYLGSVLGRKVIVKLGGDLLDCFVGGTEKRIVAAFREAEADKAILFLDEVDGLLRSRGMAQNSWEVTQVNELLHRMEMFGGVMVAATNFVADLDPAVMRRFTFKLQFDYLDDVGKKLFFERMFGTALTAAEAAELATIPNLAPGDFRTVRQGLYYLGHTTTNAQRLGMLREESRAKKPVFATRHLGFCA